MSTEEIYNEIKAILNTFPDNKSFKIGIAKDALLTWQYGRSNVWYLPNSKEAKALLKKLQGEFGLKFNKGSSGRYIYLDDFKMNHYHN